MRNTTLTGYVAVAGGTGSGVKEKTVTTLTDPSERLRWATVWALLLAVADALVVTLGLVWLLG